MRVFITGAASGIGKATVEELIDRGYEVLAVDREESGFYQEEVDSYKIDIGDTEGVEEIVGKEDFDVLVNCAGYYEQGSIEDMSLETAEEIFRSNVFGLLEVTRNSLPTLRENDGKIINVSSVAGRISLPFSGHYCASKHAVEAISDSLRMEVSDQNVDVVVVEPGVIDTGFNERAREALQKYLECSIYYQKYQQILDKEGMDGVSAEVPAKKVANIIEEDNPKRRYQTPSRTKLLVLLNKILPASIAYCLKKRIFY